MSGDERGIDSAAEDAPLLELAGATIGVLLFAGGVLWILGLAFGLYPTPAGNPLYALIVGLVLFIGSMLSWSPDVDNKPK